MDGPQGRATGREISHLRRRPGGARSGRPGRPSPHNLASLHLLEAEVYLPSGRSARKEIAYGGEYGSEVSTEMTAVPVRTEGGKLPPAKQLGEWLTAGGRPLPVAAVEKVEIVKNERDLERAVTAVRKLLESERILMVDGRHLPQSIALSPQASGVELAGAR